VEVEERILCPETERPLCERQGLVAPTRPCERPAEGVVAVDRRPVGEGTSRKLDRLGRADQVVRAVRGRLEIDLDAVGLEETIDDCDGGALTPRFGRLARAL
jgi:hypothetical protein